ncbi:unnamed protein product, partial [Scytosiphon promiscuus]
VGWKGPPRRPSRYRRLRRKGRKRRRRQVRAGAALSPRPRLLRRARGRLAVSMEMMSIALKEVQVTGVNRIEVPTAAAAARRARRWRPSFGRSCSRRTGSAAPMMAP